MHETADAERDVAARLQAAALEAMDRIGDDQVVADRLGLLPAGLKVLRATPTWGLERAFRVCGALGLEPDLTVATAPSDDDPADPVRQTRALLTAAQHLPWAPHFTGHGDPYVLGRSSHDNSRPGVFPFDVIAEVAKAAPDYGRANAELLGAAPGLLQALADEVERLRASAPPLVYLIDHRDAANKTSTVMYVTSTWDKAVDWCRRNTSELDGDGDWFALLANRIDFDDDAEVSGVLTGRYDENGLQDDRDVMAAKGYVV